MSITPIVAMTTLLTSANPAAEEGGGEGRPPAECDADAAARVGEAPTGERAYIFDGEVVDGDCIGPDGTIILFRRPTKHASLLRIRPHFIDRRIAMTRDE